ncbi:Kinase-like protein [Mycena venus]|uniref:Kinase-like protein n=1 Tax=Mycena venus TaxID=2733690 RepID=A0A8H7CSL0_9AGAR|nr:Kinase-like protein [Mycena venus]
MSSDRFDALILWDPNKAVANIPENSRSDGGRWTLMFSALLSPSPGRTLDRVYTSLGGVLEKQANRAAFALGLGPHAVAQKIKSCFGDDEKRAWQLELLRTSAPAKIEKLCLKLMRYSLPTKSAGTQCQAFKEILDLVTLFPGLRVFFLFAKYSDSTKSPDSISEVWNRLAGLPDEEWTFWKILAATSLCETAVSTLLEESAVSYWTTCDEAGLSMIEQILLDHNFSASPFSRALCIRYLRGILDLPGFWINMGDIHSHVATKLCCQMVCILKDLGVDILVLGPIDEPGIYFDHEGVDFLATTILTGISGWLGKLDQEYWIAQPWYKSFREFLQLIRMPRAAELLPNALACASSAFEDILPTIQQDAQLNIVVDSDIPKADNQDTIDNHPLVDLDFKNDSTTSVQSEISDQSDGQSLDSPQADDSDTCSENSDSQKDSLSERDLSSTPDQEGQEAHSDPGLDTQHGQGLESWPDAGQSSESHGDSVSDEIVYSSTPGMDGPDGFGKRFEPMQLGMYTVIDDIAEGTFVKIKTIQSVTLLKSHPVNGAGFSLIYHGTYTNTDMERVEVALKVLRIFHDPSDDDQREIPQRFAKEVLVWHNLRHPNIVPLLGVTTLPGLTIAMVSPWMQQGNVLNYMTQHSPSSEYAITLLNDVIQGLMYLHSENIVHGDLCTHNILMHERQAYLTEFGLATFITSRESSTPEGWPRGMAPELLLPEVYQPRVPFKRTPASDMWGFWLCLLREGRLPFQHMSDGAIIRAFSKIDANGALPYETTPFDKAGTPMPGRLWELVQWCFRHEAAMRPTVKVIADFLSEMKRQAYRIQPISDPTTSSPAGVDAAALGPREPYTDVVLINPRQKTQNMESSASAAPIQGTQMRETELITVRFGPIDLDGVDHEKLFHEFLIGILAAIRKDALVLPAGVEKHDSQHLDLRFRSVLEAHNFALTWQVYREDDHQDVLAMLV